MKKMRSDWYKNIWDLNIQDQSWTEDTKKQVDFIIDELNLKGGEKILDLACGFGRHSLEFARRGFCVTGVDITAAYIDFAERCAKDENLNARFICCDIRDTDFTNEFDVVLNMADGAVGYLETDKENVKIFEIVSKALKPGSKHFMDIMNRDYAKTHFPCRLWDVGEKCLTLSEFEWESDTNTLIYGQTDYPYGTVLSKPDIDEGNVIRLYPKDEIKWIFSDLKMTVRKTYSDFDGNPSSENKIQLMIYSEKQEY